MKNERRNKRLYKIISCFVVFLVCVFAFVSLALGKTQNKVKADSPTIYYSQVDFTSQENYTTIIIYILDAYTLIDNTTYIGLYGIGSVNQYTSIESRNVEFLRFGSYDYMDYKAYIYNWTYTPLTANYEGLFLTFNWSNLSLDDPQIVLTGDFGCVYYPTYKKYYEDGKNYGYDLGVENATEQLNEYWNNYINDTYISTSGSGYQEIYQRGRNDGINANIGTQNWFITAFGAVDRFLNIHIFPNITFGVLLGIPFVISLAWFIIRMFRGGGGD